MKYIFTSLLLSISSILFAQDFRIMGKVIDTTSQQPLPNATIVLKGISDTSFFNGSAADMEGRFMIPNLKAGDYKLQITYVGYDTLVKMISIQGDLRLGPLYVRESAKLLDNVQIDGVGIRVEQKGDTTQYNANQFKTNPDATAEDLVNKLPGITNENGTIKAQGEEVKKVLVDGKPFFGDDAAATLKNIPADMVDKVQVFDKMGNQAQFTGYDDGSGQKTINLITKNGGKGQFGKVYAGYGTDDRYSAGANFNKFNKDQRFTIIGMSNNINQQNFNNQDLLGVSSGGGGFMRRPGSSPSGFMVGPSNGIAQTHSFGLNYSDTWSEKWKFSGSYFLNYVDVDNISTTQRNYITNSDSALIYDENNTNNSINQNHRISMKLEFKPDTLNEFTLEPKFNFQDNNSGSLLSGLNQYNASALVSQLDNSSTSDFSGYTFSNEFSYRRRLKKKGRTISTTINTDLNDKNGVTGLYSQNVFYAINDTTLIDQNGNQKINGQTHSLSLVYTEPIGKKSQLLINYQPSYTINHTDKETDNKDGITGEYNSLDTLLTNKFSNTYLVQKPGLGFNYNSEKHSLNVGVDAQLATLDGTTVFPTSQTIKKEFFNILPNVGYSYKFTKTKSLRFRYRTSTSAPTISQLQEVVDNSNPLLLKTGNTSLNQSFTHMIFGRFANTNIQNGRGFFLMGHARFTSEYIGNQTIIPQSDTTLENGLTIGKGSQLSRQVNLSGYRSVSSYMTYTLPVTKIKCNINLNGGVTYNRIPALVNDNLNLANNYNFNGGLSVTSNISEKIDFTLSYAGNFSIVKNTLQTNSDNNYSYHNTSLKLNWNIWKGIIFNTTTTHTFYKGLGDNFNPNYILLNAEFGYKFLKEKQLEVKISAFDIMNQNVSVSRTVNELYIEDYSSLVLNRYFLLVVTYNLKKVGKAPEEEKPFWMKH